jgi:hypothetical protein
MRNRDWTVTVTDGKGFTVRFDVEATDATIAVHKARPMVNKPEGAGALTYTARRRR